MTQFLFPAALCSQSLSSSSSSSSSVSFGSGSSRDRARSARLGSARLDMEFLWGSPFSSEVGQRIEAATSASLPSEDWTLTMDICDVINASEHGPRDAVRALRKRIVGNKNFKEVMLALSVLETCVKNCGHRLHVLVSSRDFVEGVLLRAIIPRNNPPAVVHDRVLAIVQAWADAFRSSPDLTGVVSVYEELRRKGLEFPLTQLDRAGPGALTPRQVEQLKAELGVVRGHLTTMSDLMTRLDPSTVQEADVELLQQLYSVCTEMQERIAAAVPRLTEETLVQELLETNDQMNSTLGRYRRFERQLTNGHHAAERVEQQQQHQQQHTYVNLDQDQDLDLSRTRTPPLESVPDSLSSRFTKLSTSESQETLSPQTLTSTGQTPSGGGEEGGDGHAHVRLSSLQTAIPVSQSDVMDDVEKWLGLDDEYDDVDGDGVTSEEFDKFLAERAKAAERLPSVRRSSQDVGPSQS